MVRRLLPFAALIALFCIGCVPVVEPVGDIEKAEPDKGLVGKWTVTKSGGLAQLLDVKALTVEAPEVKGNPKGLTRGIFNTGDQDTEMWFFVTTVGKAQYASGILGSADNNEPPKFGKEDVFAEWKKAESKRYFIFQYTRDGDKLTVDCGDYSKFCTLMKDSNIAGDGSKHIEHFNTPTGWLAKYLDKTGPEKVFDGTNRMVLTREKK